MLFYEQSFIEERPKQTKSWCEDPPADGLLGKEGKSGGCDRGKHRKRKKNTCKYSSYSGQMMIMLPPVYSQVTIYITGQSSKAPQTPD